MRSCSVVVHPQALAAFALAALPLAVMAESDSVAPAGNTVSNVIVIADRYDDDQPGAEYLDGQLSTGGRVGVLGQMDGYEAPFSLMRYNQELLADEQVDSISDIASADAGVQTFLGYGNFSEQFQIRGFILNGDDVAYGGLYGVLPRQIVLTDIAESIEVFKGPSAFANGVTPGGSGVGGSINIEPKYAKEDETLVGVTYRTNSYLSANVDTAQRFGADDAVGVRLSGVFGQGDTAIDDESRSNGSGYIGLDYETDLSHTYFNVGYQHSEIDEGRSVVYLDDNLTAIPDAPDSHVNYKARWTYFEANNLFGIIRHEQNISDNLLGYIAVGANDTDEIGAYSSPKLTSTDGSATIGRLDVAYAAQSTTGQVGLEGQFDMAGMQHAVNVGYSGFIREYGFAYTWNTAADLNTNIYDPADLNYLAADSGVLGDPKLTTKTEAHGVAVSDSVDMLDGLINATVGVRFQTMTTDDGTNHYEGDDLSPVLGLSYFPTDHWALYANYIEALEEGENAGDDATNSGENIGLKKSVQYEVGAKLETPNLGAIVSLYQIQQPSAYKDASGNYDYHGEQRSRGVEFSLYGTPIQRLHLSSSAVLTEALLTETSNGDNEGNQVIGVPKYSAVLSVDFDVFEGLALTSRIVHTGPQYADAANKLELDAWTRLDLGASYQTELGANPFILRANIENVTDADYWSSAGGGYLTQGNPLTAALSATVKF